MIERVVSDLRVTVPRPVMVNESPRDANFVNLNPQCGPFPFGSVLWQYDEGDQFACFEADLTQDFVDAQIMPRGRPHFSLLHVALVDDAIASSSFTLIAQQPYGHAYRYLELAAAANFHREAFIEGALHAVPRGATYVDGFRIRWQCLPWRDHTPLVRRGVLQVSVIGVRETEEIPIASVECEYFLGKAVVRGA